VCVTTTEMKAQTNGTSPSPSLVIERVIPNIQLLSTSEVTAYTKKVFFFLRFNFN
jgi:hypothetical protein